MSDLPLEEQIRVQAYLLWEADGRPEGRSSEYWDKAVEAVMATGASAPDLTIASGSPGSVRMLADPEKALSTTGKRKSSAVPAEAVAPAKKKAKPPAPSEPGKAKKQVSNSDAAGSETTKARAAAATKKTAKGTGAKAVAAAVKEPKKKPTASEKP